jgi:hypothetical protein
MTGSRCGSAVKWWKWENKWNQEDPGSLLTPGNFFIKKIKMTNTNAIIDIFVTYVAFLLSTYNIGTWLWSSKLLIHTYITLIPAEVLCFKTSEHSKERTTKAILKPASSHFPVSQSNLNFFRSRPWKSRIHRMHTNKYISIITKLTIYVHT